MKNNKPLPMTLWLNFGIASLLAIDAALLLVLFLKP